LTSEKLVALTILGINASLASEPFSSTIVSSSESSIYA